MILDNENGHLKVHEWITRYSENGTYDLVTGYFTIGALVFLSEATHEKIENYRFVLGDIVNFDEKQQNALNLLNEKIDIESAIKLLDTSKKAVEFLKLKKIEVKTLEPNFCHAKLYLKTAKEDDRNHYFISGSSNLTEAGIGKNDKYKNIELNIAETGSSNQFRELKEWFEKLWDSPKAHLKKTIISDSGKETQINFKQYLIDEISKIFKSYTPLQIYHKILFELFKAEDIDKEAEKQITKLEDTIIYQKLFGFQKTGVKSIIKMLNKYNGAILADAVGLGKTWSALAVMKAFQSDHEVILLCPKKIEQNWSQYHSKNNSLFETDKLEFVMRFHTDLRDGGLDKDHIALEYFTNQKKKLIVIDESHNLRNDKAQRYKYLVEEILEKSKGEVKVLLLSATPINNSFKDVRNQFKLMVRGRNDGFQEHFEIASLERTFGIIKGIYNEWQAQDNAKIGDLYTKLKDSDFFKLTDNLLVARTRKQINEHFDKSLVFPKHKDIINKYITPMSFGDIENFAELIENMNLNLSAYRPSFYTLSKEELEDKNRNKGKKDAVLKDNVQREYFLVKMMQILMLKRLESSWIAFQSTVTNIFKHHEECLNRIRRYEEAKDKSLVLDIDYSEFENIDYENEFDEYTLGRGKKPVSIAEIDEKGNLELFKKDIKSDKKTLQYILNNLDEYKAKVTSEKINEPYDIKLKSLFDIIKSKQKAENNKMIIFTAYADTASYLYTQLGKHGFTNYAMVTGSENKVWDSIESFRKHAPILERFAPQTKLFNEKNWEDFESSNTEKTYTHWKQWIAENDEETNKKLINPIDILIATDVLSEGQNLQDADMVINYDIHWNPVRVIQRLGRIDRIGSPNDFIQCVNFWPAKDIDDYIDLKKRVSDRMKIMQFAGAAIIDNFDENAKEINNSDDLEARHNDKILRQMQEHLTQEDLDSNSNNVGFNDFSFDNYRQTLDNLLTQRKRELENMPHGIFSGFIANVSESQSLVALLRNRKITDYKKSLFLIHIDMNGTYIYNNERDILDFLSQNQNADTFVPANILSGNIEEIIELQNALYKWIKTQRGDDDEVGQAELMQLTAFEKGIAGAINNPKNGTINELYQNENFDLLTWLIISKIN